jgi:hypothetical protein
MKKVLNALANFCQVHAAKYLYTLCLLRNKNVGCWTPPSIRLSFNKSNKYHDHVHPHRLILRGHVLKDHIFYDSA